VLVVLYFILERRSTHFTDGISIYKNILRVSGYRYRGLGFDPQRYQIF
jgi:hypothetical protein